MQKIEFLGLEIDSVRMTLTLPQEKIKKIETEMPKAYFKLQNNTVGSDQPFRFSLLNSTGSATSYATNQVFTTAANGSYKKKSLLPVCNVSEPVFYSGIAMVVQQPGDLQWQINCVSNLQNSDTIRCLQKGLGGVLSESVNKESVVSPGVKPPFQCSGIVSHQTSLFNVFENVQSQINPFPGRQYQCPFLPDDSHFQRDLEIYIVQRDHAYCRVAAGQIERQDRLGFQKFSRLKRMATISKSISKNLCKVGIPRGGSFCIKSTPSDTILPVVESRSTQPYNRCIPAKLETSGATVCFSPFFNDRESSIKGQNREGGCNSNNTKLASTTLVQSSSGIICN